jgi:CRP-like cAMP-binding protein
MPAARSIKGTSTRTYLNGTTLFGQISERMHVMSVRKNERIFSQGDPAAAIYFIQTGRVKISVLSYTGKEGVLGILGPDDFFGEECLVGQSLRISSATALEPLSVFPVQKRAMLRALHAQPGLAQRFTTSLLKRTIDLEEDLCDQLFNQCEKRLARVLLKLAHLREYQVIPDAAMPTLSHETLAEMVGTTRARITHFMNKFRKMGLIDYDGHLIVITERLINVVLQD